MSQTYSTHAESDRRASALVQQLSAGLEVQATRSELELLFGRWSVRDELCEDGRATCVHRTPTGTRVFLTPDGMLLIVQELTVSDELYGCRRITARPAELWEGVATVFPGLGPGRNGFKRFWVLREDVGPCLDRWGVYDMRSFVVLGWCARARATALVEELNSSPDSRPAVCARSPAEENSDLSERTPRSAIR